MSRDFVGQRVTASYMAVVTHRRFAPALKCASCDENINLAKLVYSFSGLNPREDGNQN